MYTSIPLVTDQPITGTPLMKLDASCGKNDTSPRLHLQTAQFDRNYEHFKITLKRRQHFQSISRNGTRKSTNVDGTQDRKSIQSQCKPKTQQTIRRKQTADQEIKQIMMFKKKTSADLDIQFDYHQEKQPQRGHQFYSLPNISYKNYKHQRPPLGFSTEQFLVGSYKLGQRLGLWQKDKLADKINQKNPNGIIQQKERSYKADHLERSRRPQGPQSCLETIYMSKIKLEEVLDSQKTFSQSQSETIQFQDYMSQKQKKLQQIEWNLQAEITVKQVQYPSQAYILNKWTRENRDLVYHPCQRRDEQTKYSNVRKQISQGMFTSQKVMDNLIKQKSQSASIIDSNNQYSSQFSFPKFNKIKLKSNNCKDKFNQLINLQQDNKEQLLLKTFLDNFPQFTFNPPLISQRLILSLDLPDPQVTENALTQAVPYTLFQKFYRVYVEKRADINETVNAVLDFFVLDYSEPLTNMQFSNVLKIICNNVPNQNQDAKDHAQSIYHQLIENFNLCGVLNYKTEEVNYEAFRTIFTTNQMHISDMIDFINGLN